MLANGLKAFEREAPAQGDAGARDQTISTGVTSTPSTLPDISGTTGTLINPILTSRLSAHGEVGLRVHGLANLLDEEGTALLQRFDAADPRPIEEFDSGEHLLAGGGPNVRFIGVGSGITLSFGQGISQPANSWTFGLQNGVAVDFGQIVALAGDFYATMQPISTASNPQQQFALAFGTLQTGNPKEMRNILALIAKETSHVVAMVTDPDTGGNQQPSQFYTDYGSKLNALYIWYSDGRMFSLAFKNIDHFGQNAITAYSAGHSQAIQAAAAAAKLAASQQRQALDVAYAQEAYACHFLTDLLASGHLRVPRSSLMTSVISNRLANFMHNEDGALGLNVSNSQGSQWRSYGDGRFLDTVSNMTRTLIQKAVQASVNEVFNAFQSPNSLPTSANYAALSYLPSLQTVGNWTQAQAAGNSSPLFIQSSSLLARKAVSNVNDYQWNSSILFGVWLSYPSDTNQFRCNAALSQPTTTVSLGAWGQNAPASGTPQQYGPNWVAGNSVRYAVAFFNANTGEESYPGPWTSWNQLIYAFPTLSGVPVDPSQRATGRVIYRQFQGPNGNRPPERLFVILNNSATTWQDIYFPTNAMIPPATAVYLDPTLWGQTAPKRGNQPIYGPNWVAGNKVRYTVAFVDEAGNESYPGPWCAWNTIAYAYPTLVNIPVDTSGRAIGRIVYRQFQVNTGSFAWPALAPEAIYTIPNNTQVQWQDESE